MLNNEGLLRDCIKNTSSAIKYNGSKIKYYDFITSLKDEDCVEALIRIYPKIEIEKINKGVDEIITTEISNDMSIEDKILKIHDYIINNTRYDINKSSNYSYTAMGPLFNGTAVCSGYADLMAIFLTKFGVKNFKVASDTHVWNAVNVNGEWLSLDLTWDDPVTKNSDVDTLLHQFFLVNKQKLFEFDTKDHNYDATIYQELN